MRRTIGNLFKFADYKNYKSQYGKSDGESGSRNNYQSENFFESSLDIKNYNLMMPLEKYNVSFYLLPPSIVKKTSNVFEIRKTNVLGIIFIPKISESEVDWSKRKAFSFKLLDIGKLLYV